MKKLRNLIADFFRSPAHQWHVSLDGNHLTCTHKKTRTVLDLNEIDKIFIHTTDEGPWRSDVFWIVESKGASVTFPKDALGGVSVSEYFHKMTGVDLRASIEASFSTGNETFKFYDKENLVDPSQWKDTRPAMRNSDFLK